VQIEPAPREQLDHGESGLLTVALVSDGDSKEATILSRWFSKHKSQFCYIDKEIWFKHSVVQNITGGYMSRRLWNMISHGTDGNVSLDEILKVMIPFMSTDEPTEKATLMFQLLDRGFRGKISETDVHEVLDALLHSRFAEGLKESEEFTKFRKMEVTRKEAAELKKQNVPPEHPAVKKRHKEEERISKRTAELFAAIPKHSKTKTGKVELKQFIAVTLGNDPPAVLKWFRMALTLHGTRYTAMMHNFGF